MNDIIAIIIVVITITSPIWIPLGIWNVYKLHKDQVKNDLLFSFNICYIRAFDIFTQIEEKTMTCEQPKK